MLLKFAKGQESALDEILEEAERVEVDAIVNDPKTAGLALLSRDGAAVRAEGVWADSAPAVFSNVINLVDRMGEEIGEARRTAIIYCMANEFEVAIAPLARCDAIIIRHT